MVDADRLLTWFQSCARDLPWRTEPRDPYAVLVSELMLQQTQVDRVRQRFEQFIETYPTIEKLAAANEEAVVAAWSGLGYYRRARLLHRLAREVVAGSGKLPRLAAELERLPGIGPYTAAAVASLSFGEAVPVLDGNVMRVGSRVLALGENPRSSAGRGKVLGWVADLLVGQPAGQVNEALMELGATVCLPRSPRCDECPISDRCLAKSEGDPDRYPLPRQTRAAEVHRWVAACCIDSAGKWLLKRIDEGPILRGLWLPPFTSFSGGGALGDLVRSLLPFPITAEMRVLDPIQHSITHRRIRVHPVILKLSDAPDLDEGWQWTHPRSVSVPTSSLLQKLAAAAAMGRP